jgi:uncharacterized membrane protein YdbT with pleckstrin-like domain
MNEINKILSDNEKVIWEGKPQFAPFFISQLTWQGCLTFIFIFIALIATISREALVGLEFFLFGCIFALTPLITYLNYRKLFYSITDKRIIFQSGIIGTDFNSVDFDKIQSMNVNVGLFDKIFGKNSGTISVFSGTVTTVNNGGVVSIPYKMAYIENAYEVFEKLKKVSHDVKTDIEFPNDLRPENNPGYRTEYKA